MRSARRLSFISAEAHLAAHLKKLAKADPSLAPILALAGEVPLRRIEPGLAGLAWIIAGQQISASAARAIFGRVEAALGAITAASIAAADDAALKGAGLSAPKIRTLRAVAGAVLQGAIDFGNVARCDAEEAVAALSAIKGIGRWTAEVYLLFALGHPDVFPARDLALQEAARIGFDLPERPGERELLARAEIWRPRRAAAARLLWAYYRAVKTARAANIEP